MTISIIVAVAQNNVMGKDNKLPWYFPADMRYFKTLTTGHHVIMGRATYESMGRPLQNRTNIVITRQKDFKADGCIVFHDLKSAFEHSRSNQETECFVIGGAEIIQQAQPWADKIYLTRIFHDYDGDIFFPALAGDWMLTHEERHEPDEKNPYPYSFQVFELARKFQV